MLDSAFPGHSCLCPVGGAVVTSLLVVLGVPLLLIYSPNNNWIICYSFLLQFEKITAIKLTIVNLIFTAIKPPRPPPPTPPPPAGPSENPVKLLHRILISLPINGVLITYSLL